MKSIPFPIVHKAVTPLTISAPFSADPLHIGAEAYGLGQKSFQYRGNRIVGHTGDLPGQKSILLGAPDKGVALMMANNDDSLGTVMNEAVAYMVLDDLLGLEPLDWDDRIFGDELRVHTSYPAPPMDPRSPPAQEVLAGEYRNAGYGTLTLVPSNHSSHNEPERSVMSSPHRPVNITGPILVARMQKGFATHVVFTHFDGPLFNWTLVDPVLDRRGKKTQESVGAVKGTGSALFLEREGGLGMFGNWWGQGEEVKQRRVVEEDVERMAEVWFDKVGVFGLTE